MSYNRLAYINPAGSAWLDDELTKQAALISTATTRPATLAAVRQINPTAYLCAQVNPGMVRCLTSGGRWSAWHRWEAAQLTMPEVRLAEQGRACFAQGGWLYHDGIGWPQVQSGYIANELSSLKRAWRGEFKLMNQLECVCAVITDALEQLPIDRIDLDMAPGYGGDGFPHNDELFIAEMSALAPLRDKISANVWDTRWSGAFPESGVYAAHRKLESIGNRGAGWRRAYDDFDGAWIDWDGTEFGRKTEGYLKCASNRSTLCYNPKPSQAGDEARHKFYVGFFMLLASAVERDGPYLAMHAYLYPADPNKPETGKWDGIMAPHRAELLEWTRMKPTMDVLEIPKEHHPDVSTPTSRVLVRQFTDDGGKKWSITVNMSRQQYIDCPPLSAKRVQEL